MRRLPKEIGHNPKVLALSLGHFFTFGALAALERLLIADGVMAFSAIAITYGVFMAHERFIPKRPLFYLLTKIDHFELEDGDEDFHS